jgi:uncharacterized protein (TIGR00725 family)
VGASPRIAVYGSSTVTEGDRAYHEALDLGAALARAGAVVMTGGYAGTMEAASRGAREAGGHVIGVTLESDPSRPPNRWVGERVHAPDLFERLRVLILSADGIVAVAASLGTFTEVLLAWTLLSLGARPRVPLVLLGKDWPAWLEATRRAGAITDELLGHVTLAATPAEAARLVLAGAGVSARGDRP